MESDDAKHSRALECECEELLAEARQAERERILKMAEDTCSRNYHDSERVCDEHEVDDSQGNIWSANDLLSYLKQRLSGK